MVERLGEMRKGRRERIEKAPFLLSFPCSSVSEALFALSFSFVSESFFSVLFHPC